MRLAIAALAFVLWAGAASAQQATVIAACGTPPRTLAVGQMVTLFMDVHGYLCVASHSIASLKQPDYASRRVRNRKLAQSD